MARLLETDSLSNQNISSALAIGAHTCATVPRVVFVRALVNQVVGGGDYIIYATLTKGGVEYRVIPITTATAAAALTSIAFVSVGIPMDVGDILMVYLDGLAGDTTTPDTQVDFYEADYLRPATADRTLAVTATGEARAVNASDEALATATALATVSGNVDSVLADTGTDGIVLKAAGLAADAVAEIADAVWDETAADHVTSGSMGAKQALITSGSVTVTSPASADGTLLTIVRGDDYNNSDSRALDFESDDWPTLTSATITMTIRYAKALVLTKAGSVVTGTGTTKKVRVELTAAQTALFSVGTKIYDFDVQATLATSSRKVTLARGKVTVLEDQTT